jgi:hypothetical protein
VSSLQVLNFVYFDLDCFNAFEVGGRVAEAMLILLKVRLSYENIRQSVVLPAL